MDKFEIIKSIGVLLSGIGIFFSLIFYKIYQRVMTSRDLFYAYCDNEYITTKANKELKSIYISYENELVCNYSLILKNNYKICDVRNFTKNKTIATFIASSNKLGEKLMHCYNYIFEIKNLENV